MSDWSFVIQNPDGENKRIEGNDIYQDYDGKWKYSEMPISQQDRLSLLRGRRNANNTITYWFDSPKFIADTEDELVAKISDQLGKDVRLKKPAFESPAQIMPMPGGGIPQIASVTPVAPVAPVEPVITSVPGEIDYETVEKYRDQRLSVAKINAFCKACNLNFQFTTIRKRRNRGFDVNGLYHYIMDGNPRSSVFSTNISGHSDITCINFLNRFLSRHRVGSLDEVNYENIRISVVYHNHRNAQGYQLLSYNKAFYANIIREIKNYCVTFYKYHRCIRISLLSSDNKYAHQPNPIYDPIDNLDINLNFTGINDPVYKLIRHSNSDGKYTMSDSSYFNGGKDHSIHIGSFHREKTQLDNWLNSYLDEISKK